MIAICGAHNWFDIKMFGKKKETWLRQFLELPNGATEITIIQSSIVPGISHVRS